MKLYTKYNVEIAVSKETQAGLGWIVKGSSWIRISVFSEESEGRPGCQHSLRRRWVLQREEGLASPGEGLEGAKAQVERTGPGGQPGRRGRRVSRCGRRWGGSQKPDAEGLARHAVRVLIEFYGWGPLMAFRWWVAWLHCILFASRFILLDFWSRTNRSLHGNNWNCSKTGKGIFQLPPPPRPPPAASDAHLSDLLPTRLNVGASSPVEVLFSRNQNINARLQKSSFFSHKLCPCQYVQTWDCF